ncbi:MAG: hypothetical protein J0L88_04565 [Xanthomonadales bacterium]|nr:hypothetical protein [Xanthomonadales bacterium]
MSSPVLWIMLCMLIALAIASVRRIPEGQVYSLRRVDGQTRFVGAGTRFLLPLLERVSHKISLTGSALAIDGMRAAGEPWRGALYFQVVDPARADRIIESVDGLLRESARALLARVDAPADAAECRHWLKQTLNAEVRERGLLVTRIELRPADAA